MAEVLLGDYNPGGKLPVTFYRSNDDLPDFLDYSMDNRTYRYFRGRARDPLIQEPPLAPGETAKASITLDGEAFEYYDPSIDELSTRPGRYQILYGCSSRDEDLQSIDFVVK